MGQALSKLNNQQRKSVLRFAEAQLTAAHPLKKILDGTTGIHKRQIRNFAEFVAAKPAAVENAEKEFPSDADKDDALTNWKMKHDRALSPPKRSIGH